MAEATVFIIDDDEAFRDSVQELVSSVRLPSRTFRSAIEFLETFDTTQPGCLVLDVRMAHMSGIALQARLKEMGARIPIVFISGHGDIATAVKAIKEGGVDFVQKPYHEQQLLDAINEGLRRDAAQRRPEAASDDLAARLAALTAREREVMDLALKGHSSKAIAKQLSISYRTVEQHRSRLLEKVGVATMSDLLRLTLNRSSG
jgi:two-component system response regulator DctR